MHLAPQPRALFEQHNWQECSRTAVLLTFWLRNVLRAKAARTFSTAQLPRALGPWQKCFWKFDFETRFAPQPRALFKQHNFQELRRLHFDSAMCFTPQPRAIFDLSHSSAPARGCFSEPTFRSSGASKTLEKHGKQNVSRLFYLFARFDLLSAYSLSLSSLPILTTVAAPVHLTSKLPSNNYSITAMTNSNHKNR